MKFDKETVIGITICMVLLLAWPAISRSMGWTAEPETSEAVQENPASAEAAAPQTGETAPQAAAKNTPAKNAPAANDQDAAENAPAANAQDAAENAPAANVQAAPHGAVLQAAPAPAPEITRSNDIAFGNASIDLTVSGENGSIKTIRFLKYKHNDMERDITLDNAGLFALEIPNAVISDVMLTKNDTDNSVTSTVTITANGNVMRLTRVYTIKNDYEIDCRYTVTNIGQTPVTLTGAVVRGGSLAPWHTISGDDPRRISYRLDYLASDGDFEDIDGAEDDEDYFVQAPVQVRWASASNRYFCTILKPVSAETFQLWQENPRQQVTDSRNKKHYLLVAGAQLPEIRLFPGESKEFEFAAYTGPKSSSALADFVDGGEKVMHLAWGPLNLLARFLMWVLNLLFSICHSYGVSIIILTLLVRTAFYPLTSKGNESMRKMQKVQPKFKELREKYKDNPQLLNQKMTELYRQEGINPLAGCLPILLQIPIFFALYAMLDNAVALRHVSFLWAKNLAAADTVFSIPLGFTLPLFDINAIPINPLVLMMTALMVIQQRMTPMSMDPAQKKMMVMMPVIMLLFLYSLPSGLTLYWTISNIYSIIQLWLQQKKRNQALQADADGQSK